MAEYFYKGLLGRFLDDNFDPDQVFDIDNLEKKLINSGYSEESSEEIPLPNGKAFRRKNSEFMLLMPHKIQFFNVEEDIVDHIIETESPIVYVNEIHEETIKNPLNVVSRMKYSDILIGSY